MARNFSITEEDLAELERTLPGFAQLLAQSNCSNKVRTQLRRLQQIVSNVRWEYGPPTLVDTIPHGDQDTTGAL